MCIKLRTSLSIFEVMLVIKHSCTYYAIMDKSQRAFELSDMSYQLTIPEV